MCVCCVFNLRYDKQKPEIKTDEAVLINNAKVPIEAEVK